MNLLLIALLVSATSASKWTISSKEPTTDLVTKLEANIISEDIVLTIYMMGNKELKLIHLPDVKYNQYYEVNTLEADKTSQTNTNEKEEDYKLVNSDLKNVVEDYNPDLPLPDSSYTTIKATPSNVLVDSVMGDIVGGSKFIVYTRFCKSKNNKLNIEFHFTNQDSIGFMSPDFDKAMLLPSKEAGLLTIFYKNGVIDYLKKWNKIHIASSENPNLARRPYEEIVTIDYSGLHFNEECSDSKRQSNHNCKDIVHQDTEKTDEVIYLKLIKIMLKDFQDKTPLFNKLPEKLSQSVSKLEEPTQIFSKYIENMKNVLSKFDKVANELKKQRAKDTTISNEKIDQVEKLRTDIKKIIDENQAFDKLKTMYTEELNKLSANSKIITPGVRTVVYKIESVFNSL